MCSRYENRETYEAIFNIIRAIFEGEISLDELDPDNFKKTNIAPTDDILTLVNKDGVINLTSSSWGIKFKEDGSSPLIFNSRIETIRDKKFWTELFFKNRCLVPATAFYEWKPEGKMKIPQRISLPKHQLFFLAGIYFIKQGIKFASIITVNSNDVLEPLKSRMPLILNIQEAKEFLTGEPLKVLEKEYKMCEKMKIEVANDILTVKQTEFLQGSKK